jgi:hypothetical protein
LKFRKRQKQKAGDYESAKMRAWRRKASGRRKVRADLSYMKSNIREYVKVSRHVRGFCVWSALSEQR